MPTCDHSVVLYVGHDVVVVVAKPDDDDDDDDDDGDGHLNMEKYWLFFCPRSGLSNWSRVTPSSIIVRTAPYSGIGCKRVEDQIQTHFIKVHTTLETVLFDENRGGLTEVLALVQNHPEERILPNTYACPNLVEPTRCCDEVIYSCVSSPRQPQSLSHHASSSR